MRLNRAIEGTIDLFTKEVDTYDMFYKIENALKEVEIPFRLNTVQYEEDTGYKHYECAIVECYNLVD